MQGKDGNLFSELERDYIQSQRLARIATVSSDGQPDAAAVAFDFDGTHFYVGGQRNPQTLKYKNVVKGNLQVGLVLDDQNPDEDGLPRGIKLHGRAEIVQRAGYAGEGAYLKITPTAHWHWGLVEPMIVDDQIVVRKTLW
jgi:pyridoxamine 5'-phosphate oxidase family protein